MNPHGILLESRGFPLESRGFPPNPVGIPLVFTACYPLAWSCCSMLRLFQARRGRWASPVPTDATACCRSWPWVSLSRRSPCSPCPFGAGFANTGGMTSDNARGQREKKTTNGFKQDSPRSAADRGESQLKTVFGLCSLLPTVGVLQLARQGCQGLELLLETLPKLKF